MEYNHGILSIKTASRKDIESLKENLRLEDAREIIAAGYDNPEMCLEHGFSHSTESYTVFIDGKACAMFGIVPRSLLGAEAVIWFLGSPEMSRIKKSFMKFSRLFVEKWKAVYPCLYNIVPRDYAKSLAWLRWLGVNVDKPIEYNGEGWQLMAFVRGV